MIAPAMVARRAPFELLDLHGRRLSFLTPTTAVAIVAIFAPGELLADLLPATPNRTSAGPLLALVLTGTSCGAAFSVAGGTTVALGAAIGAIGGVAGALAGYSVRHAKVQYLKLPDGAVAVAEDLIAFGCGLLLVSQF